MKHTLYVSEVKQNIGVFYIGKINGCLLYRMAKADIRRITTGQSYEGIQRELDRSRVSAIKNYLKTSFASFPNTIILNLNSEYLLEQTTEFLEIREDENTFSIIDGQHRLSGFEDQDFKDFELPVTIFIDLDIEDQAYLFSTINSEQKSVNPSLKLDLENYSKVDTPKKLLSQMAYAFNIDEASPWKGRIKLAGKKDENAPDGIISQKAFVSPILQYVYDEKDTYTIRDKLLNHVSFSVSDYDSQTFFLWKFFAEGKMKYLYKILFNYFSAIHNILSEDWYSGTSILSKTTGYNAVMMLFKDIYFYCDSDKDFTQKHIEKYLKPIGVLRGELTADKFGASGTAASSKLYHRMKDLLYKNQV